jgi:cytosine/uracil/thiamine/allantoin permease
MDLPEPAPKEITSSGDIIVVDPNPTPEQEEKTDFSDPETHRKHLSNIQIAQNIEERKKYGRYSYILAILWTVFIIIVISAQFIARLFGSGLHSEEFIAVVTTTTASVFGFWYLGGRYLFPKDGGSE